MAYPHSVDHLRALDLFRAAAPPCRFYLELRLTKSALMHPTPKAGTAGPAHPFGAETVTGTRLLRRTPAGQSGRLSDPRRHLRLVEIVLVDVDLCTSTAGDGCAGGNPTHEPNDELSCSAASAHPLTDAQDDTLQRRDKSELSAPTTCWMALFVVAPGSPDPNACCRS